LAGRREEGGELKTVGETNRRDAAEETLFHRSDVPIEPFLLLDQTTQTQD
jgi:hypothetical protein